MFIYLYDQNVWRIGSLILTWHWNYGVTLPAIRMILKHVSRRHQNAAMLHFVRSDWCRAVDFHKLRNLNKVQT